MSAQGIALGCGVQSYEAPKRAALIPNIPFIQFNSMSLTQCSKFVLERHLLMMLFLVGDIFPDLGTV